jgi:hypothetical protein
VVSRHLASAEGGCGYGAKTTEDGARGSACVVWNNDVPFSSLLHRTHVEPPPPPASLVPDRQGFMKRNQAPRTGCVAAYAIMLLGRTTGTTVKDFDK